MSGKKIRQVSWAIVENPEVGRGIFRMELSGEGFAGGIAAGRFVMVRTAEGSDPLLRRAFSIHDAGEGCIRILYKVVGRGTGWLARRRRGETVDLLGPLGRGFRIPQGPGKAWLVAGGMGIAPFPLLVRELRQRGVQPTLFFGARCAEEVVEVEGFGGADCPVLLSTEDGSRGERGRVTDLLAERIRSGNSGAEVYACGPPAMLQRVSRLCLEAGLSCQVSLETEMACGLGTCMGCVAPTSSGYRRVCREGPVFDAQEILWPGPGGAAGGRPGS